MSTQNTPDEVPVSSPAVIPVSNTRRWAIVALLFLASLINYFDRATVSFALPLIAKEFSLGPVEKGRLLSAFFWSYALMQIPLGWCADRMNLRWLYAGAFALWSVAQGLTGLATGLGMLMAFRLLLGIGEAIYLPGGSKIVSLLFSPRERGLPAGIFDFGTRTGLVVEGLLVPWMLEHWGWRKTFVVVGFTALLWLVPWMLTLPKRIALKSHRTEGEHGTWPEFLTVLAFSGLLLLSLFVFLSLPQISAAYSAFVAQLLPSGLFYSALSKISGRSVSLAIGLILGALLVFAIWFASLKMFAFSRSGSAKVLLRALTACRNRNLIGICIGFFFFDYYWYFLVSWLPDYLVTVRQLTIMKAGFYASLPYLVFGASEPIGGWIADRLIHLGWDETRTRKTIVTIAFLTGLFLIPAAQVQNANTAILLVIGGSFVGLATGNLLVILQSCSPHEEIGLWTGIYNFIGNVAGILAPLMTGFLIKTTGSYRPAFVLAAVSVAAGQLAFWLIVGRLRHEAGRPITS